MKFYELQQRQGNHWARVGFYKTKKAAREGEKEFNTRTMIAPTRIVEREFLD
jgi:hypothetical protein